MALGVERLAATLQFVKRDVAIEDLCPVCATADLVCAKWTILVIRDLAGGCSRFCELERSLAGISPRTLSLRLRALEEEGIVERRTYPEVPPRVEYELTDKGRALLPLIDDMRQLRPRMAGRMRRRRRYGLRAAHRSRSRLAALARRNRGAPGEVRGHA